MILGLEHAGRNSDSSADGCAHINLDAAATQYLVSASLLASGLLSLVQITRFRLFNTKYYVGTGLLSVVGTSLATISIVS